MKKINLAITLAVLNAVAFAQEKTGAELNVDVNQNGGGTSFPWMYLIGAIVLIVLLFALLGGSRRGSDRVIERDTVVRH